MDFYALQDSLQRATKAGSSSEAIDVEEQYNLIEKVGRGSYGDVWRATRRNGSKELYAIKRVDKRAAGTKGLRSVMGEVETMSLLSHPNIVKLEETFQDDAYLWIVMEFLRRDSLQNLLDHQHLSESETRRYITQLLMAIEYIHDKGIVHRDLKPSNCLLSQNDLVVKISDFGLSVLVGNEECLTARCGTLHYMAPEILLETNYGKSVDMWALGVMAHVMYLGRYPFLGRTEVALTRDICRGYHPPSDEMGNELSSSAARCPPLLQDFVNQLLAFDPHRRLTAKEALKHPWIKAGIELNRRTSFSAGPLSTSLLPTPLARWRAAVLAVMAAHRLQYLQQLKRMESMGYGDFAVLRDFHYLMTGTFEPRTASLECSNVFQVRPMALLGLFAMLETCTTVKHVDLSRNNIHSLAIVQAFLKVLAKHPSIQSIDLSHNPIPAMAGRAIVRLARSPLSRVTSINVGDTGISADTIAQINALLKEKLVPHTPPPEMILMADRPVPPPARGASGGSCEQLTGSTATLDATQTARPKRHAANSAPKRPPEKNARALRLPPITRLPPARYSDKAS